MSIATVVVDSGLNKSLDYSIPEGLTVKIGSRVEVPMRGRLLQATVIGLKESSNFSTRPITRVLPTTLTISPPLFKLASWMSTYYMTPFRKLLPLFLPSAVTKGTKAKTQLFITYAKPKAKMAELAITLRKKSPKQAAVLDALLQKPKGLLLTELLETANVTAAPVKTLLKKEYLHSKEVFASPLETHDFFPTKPKTLSEEQAHALDAIIGTKGYKTHLLHGITGSGKTEVYLQAIAHMRSLGKSVIMLVPEIALTTQTIERFRSRLQEKIAVLHHRLSDGERAQTYLDMREEKVHIVIGARSALFSPLTNLGLIIIDEEHDSSYKQSDSMPCYHARDSAIMRAYIEKFPIILGSATPSLETYHNALSGKYSLLPLHKRASSAQRPTIHTVDMKEEFEKSDGFTLFSSRLITAMSERIARGEQTLLFLNKRGYHSFKLCTECGESISCPHCSTTLTFHKTADHLTCHLCSYTLAPPPKACPSCKNPASLTYKGFGTEQVERSLHALLPEVRTLRMDADTTRHKGSHDRLFKQFRSGKADVLIGTQMIAKGLHFPSVTLVGVLASDGALNIPDFRSAESVFSLITQVAGRSGRGALPGEVVIQTMLPNSPVIKLAAQDDYISFYNQEIKERELFSYPPFTRLCKLTFSGTSENQTLHFAQQCHQALLKCLPSSYTLYPVVPSGHAKIKDKYRFKLLIKAQAFTNLDPLLPKMPKDVRLHIDVDPITTFF